MMMGFTVGLMTSYHHVIPGQQSLACGKLPPQPGATGTAMLSQQGNPRGSAALSFDSAGVARFQIAIFQFGTYQIDVSVTNNGKTAMATGTVNVMAADSTCP